MLPPAHGAPVEASALMDESSNSYGDQVMAKYQEPEVIDARRLEAGDQIGCLTGGVRIQVMTCDPDDQIDPIWVALRNNPGETTHLWDVPVPHGSVALKLGSYEHDWKLAVLPQVWARRLIK
jgi:hypothetical protein